MFNYLADGGVSLSEPPDDEIDDEFGPDENEQIAAEVNRPFNVAPPPSYLQQDSPFQEPKPEPKHEMVDYPVLRRFDDSRNGDYGGETKHPAGSGVMRPSILRTPLYGKQASIGAPTQPEAIGIPTPIESADLGSPGPLPPPAPRIVGKDTTYAGALKTLGEIEAQRPQMTPPKWWQKGLAAGLGGAAGWSNAAGRARPIDISSATENILHPGYKTKLEEWQNKVIPAQQQADILGQQLTSQRASEIAQSQEQLRQAQAIQDMQHGKYWESRSEQERNQWKIDPKSGNLYNTINGQVVPKAPTAKDRYDTALALGASKDDARVYGLTGKLTVTPTHVPTISTAALAVRAAGGTTGNPQIDAMDPKAAHAAIEAAKDRDPLADLYRQTMMDQRAQGILDNIGKQKIDEEHRIIHDRDELLKPTANGSVSPEDAARVNANAVSQLQSVQDQFARNARARGIQADDWDVRLENGNIAYRKRSSVAPATPPQQLQRTMTVTPPPAQQKLPITAPPVAQAAPHQTAPKPAIGQPVTVDGKPAIVTGINPATGKPIVRFQ